MLLRVKKRLKSSNLAGLRELDIESIAQGDVSWSRDWLTKRCEDAILLGYNSASMQCVRQVCRVPAMSVLSQRAVRRPIGHRVESPTAVLFTPRHQRDGQR